VYTDIACWDVANGRVQDALKEVLLKVPELKKRLLFGSDWHMIMIVSPFDNYDDYCKKWKRYLDEIDEKLWVRFSLVNAFEFYGFDNEQKLININKGLKSGDAKTDFRESGFKKMIEIKKEVEILKEAFKQWDQYE
jgi:hypothetical protein